MSKHDLKVDRFEPDFEGECQVCENGPTVTGVHKGKVVYDPQLCGPCMFGTAEALDPTTWNSGDY